MDLPDHGRDAPTAQKISQYTLAALSFMLALYFTKASFSESRVKPWLEDDPKPPFETMEDMPLELGAAASMFLNVFVHYHAAEFRDIDTDPAEAFTMKLAMTSLSAGFIAAIAGRPEIIFGFILANLLNAVQMVRVVNQGDSNRRQNDARYFLQDRVAKFLPYNQPTHKAVQYSFSAYNGVLAMILAVKAVRSGSTFCLLSALNQLFNAGSHYKAAHYVDKGPSEKTSVYLGYLTSLLGLPGGVAALQKSPAFFPLIILSMMLFQSFLNALPHKKMIINDPSFTGDLDLIGSDRELTNYRKNLWCPVRNGI